jgi:hypothetical protein
MLRVAHRESTGESAGELEGGRPARAQQTPR